MRGLNSGEFCVHTGAFGDVVVADVLAFMKAAREQSIRDTHDADASRQSRRRVANAPKQWRANRSPIVRKSLIG